jgi:hypothetical protein
MKQYGLLLAAFGGTLAVLLVAFLVIEQLGAGSAVASATPSPSPSAIAFATPRLVTPGPNASASASTAPSPSAGPTATPTEPDATATPTRTPAPSLAPGTTIEIVVLGHEYVSSEVASNGKISLTVGAGILMSSTREFSNATSVEYKLPPGKLPPGTIIKRLDVAICGKGEGDFWETYGPADADPTEDEVTNPDADGCWHYLGGNGKDTTAKAIIEKQSSLRIDKVVYTVTAR